MSFKLLLSFLFWCGMVELALGMQNPTHPGPFLSPQQQHARALQQLEQQQQLQYQQLQQQQAAVAAQRLATQSASSGHPIADLRSAQLPSGGTDVAAQLAAQMERLTNMMEARLGALESRFAAQVPAGPASSGAEGARRAGIRHPRRAVLARPALVATAYGDGSRSGVLPVQYGSVRVSAARAQGRVQPAMVAGGGSASSVVTWACGQSGSASVPRVRYGMDWGRSVAPEPVQALVVTHLQGLAPDQVAFSAGDLWSLCEALPGFSFSSVAFIPVLFVVLAFCTFLHPDSLLSVAWARVSEVEGLAIFQYKPLNFRQSTSGAEQWFRSALSQCGLGRLVELHTLYSLRRGGASAARAAGVPLEVIESFGGWSAGSVALRQHYLDMGVSVSPAARAIFGPLASGRVAPFAAQFFNRGSCVS
ncbi:hypothetical protein Vafri_14039 [Volvox africanus]|uniref:Tyr recombinase domain-containing protein n=1 Tax=Volvox africanus TaxID=51714 RepID=A0A8J4F725_9CHLO|nr:hypothetical protein Vafri_14039 [Volvox africanus]